MRHDGRLMEMLSGYAASHQHPINVFVHMIGIPTILFGALVPLTWFGTGVAGVEVNLAHVAMAGFFLFYLSLDKLFAVVFLILAMLIIQLAGLVGEMPRATAWSIAAVAFFGGFAAQFVGHAVERAMPVLVKHPVEAALAAPFFIVVELFRILGLRDALFNEVRAQVQRRRAQQA